jgi:UDP-2,3-diacylglucosamine hydrolase
MAAFLPGTVIVGDLHLDLFSTGGVTTFVDWCEGLDVPRLVILGDLFEFWVGPGQARLPGARAALEALADLTYRGTAVDVLWGNRDFLLGRHFERATGARVHPDGLLGEHPGGPTLVIHGDELCTLDRSYQRFKRVMRAGPVRWTLAHLPFPLAKRMATGLRRQSQRSIEAKPAPTKTMQPWAAGSLAAREQAQVLVCGHAHEFRDGPLPGGEGRWLVIDAWGGARDALVLDEWDWNAFHSGDL